jgi:ubiquinone/menaquinone biosynthesis C-methylase UbiE
MNSKPRLYDEFASWWPVLSAPEDYAEEAEIIRRVLTESTLNKIETVLELGSGGGNNASHLKAHFKMTLVDISPGMLKVS